MGSQHSYKIGPSGSSGFFWNVTCIIRDSSNCIYSNACCTTIGLFSAIYLAEFASRNVRNIIKPTLKVLAGIPTVVYGYFAALTAAPFFRKVGMSLGLDVSSESALAAGAVMGIMISRLYHHYLTI